ncbi:MAG: response regulator [Opitutus sp.]
MEPAQKILLIDDDPLVAQLIGLLVGAFRGTQYVLDHSPDYAGGLQRLLGGSYALCLLDYRLGDGDGLELLRNAKSRECPTPIILLTGDTREEIDLAAMESGAADYICKTDFKAETFEQVVDYAIKTEAARRQLRAGSQRSGASSGSQPDRP